MKTRHAVVPLALALAPACAPTVVTTPHAARATKAGPAEPAQAPPPKTSPRPASYAAMFDDLFARIDRLHVFADRVRPLWPEREARLRTEASHVSSREEALVTLAHVEAALGDRHCYLTPPSDLRSKRLSLGLSLFAEARGADVEVRVDEVLDATLVSDGKVDVAEGDRVVAVDGVPVRVFLDAHPFESSSLNPAVELRERAQSIVSARLPYSLVREGDVRRLRLRRGDAEHDVELAFVHPSRWEDREEVSLDDAPSMASIGCRDDKRPLYEGFELTAVGQNLCVYRATRGRRDTALVRFVSFNYGQVSSADQLRATKADHEMLRRELAKAKAVVLDVHENHGGQNPFVFVSWFSGRPWDHQEVHARVAPELSEDDVRQILFGSTTLTSRYLAAQRAGETEVTWPFLCVEGGKTQWSGTCESKGPRPEERVTEAPVALVTGPECTSSCDSLTADWAAFGMGPVVGQQPAHGFTTARYAMPIVGPDGRDLGLFRVALSWEGYPRTGRSLEGAEVHLDWEAPSTFETRRTWVAQAVDEARRRVERR
jgi:hypothetical protein